MKRFPLILLCLFLFAGPSYAVPLQLSGGSFDVQWEWGGGFVDYTPYVMSDAIELAEGDTVDVRFGKLSIPVSLGKGLVTFGVEFSSPILGESAEGVGAFNVFSFLFFTKGSLEFGSPGEFGYSYNGLTDGILTVGFDDISGIKRGKCVEITGSITNRAEPAAVNPVPEPATLLLLGTGLLGFAGTSWKKVLKKK